MVPWISDWDRDCKCELDPPAAAAEDDEDDDEDEEGSARHPDDDGQLLLVEGKAREGGEGGVEGQLHLLLAHPSGVDGDTLVAAKVGRVHIGDGEAEVPFNTTWREGLVELLSERLWNG